MTIHPWLANHPDAIDWPDKVDREFVRRVRAVTSDQGLLDIARVAVEARTAVVSQLHPSPASPALITDAR